MGGSASSVIESARRMLEEFDVAIACGPEEEREGSLRGEAIEAGIRLIEINSLRERASILADRRALREIGEAIRTFAPSLVHTHQARAGVLGRMAAQKAGVRRTVHSFHAPVEGPGRGEILRGVNVTAERRLAHATDRLIAVSESLRDDLIRQKIASPERMEVIFPLAQPKRLFEEPPPATLRRQLGISPESPLLGLVGRLAPPKEAALFLRVFAIVSASIPEARAAIVGDGPERPALEATAFKLGIKEKVFFIGWQSDTRPVYPDLDILLVTSRHEGYALAALEALAVCRPVVGTNVTGVVDIVDHGSTGLLAPSGDAGGLAGAVILLLRDAVYRSRLAAAGREAVSKKFAEQEAAPRIAALYRRLLKMHTRDARRLSQSPAL